jgi:hypothetical protein
VIRMGTGTVTKVYSKSTWPTFLPRTVMGSAGKVLMKTGKHKGKEIYFFSRRKQSINSSVRGTEVSKGTRRFVLTETQITGRRKPGHY